MAADFSPNSPGQPSSPSQGQPSQPQQQPGQRATAPTSQGGEAGGMNDMIAAMQREMSEMKGKYESSLSENRKQQKTLSKLQQAFSDEDGGEQGEGEPEWFEGVLGEILKAREQGMELPITSQLAVQLHKSQQETAELKKVLQKLAGGVEKLQDPETTVDNRAYDNMDGLVGEQLANVYGDDYPPTIGKAVTQSIVGFLKDLRRENPDQWSKIRRSQVDQRKIVQHFVNQHIPKNLRQLAHNVSEAQRPFTYQDSLEAYQEAMQLPPEQRAKVMPTVRAKMWETMYSKNNRRFNN